MVNYVILKSLNDCVSREHKGLVNDCLFGWEHKRCDHLDLSSTCGNMSRSPPMFTHNLYPMIIQQHGESALHTAYLPKINLLNW